MESLVFKASDLPNPPFDNRETPGIDRAEAILLEQLAGGPRRYQELLAAIRTAGLSGTTMSRAGERLGIERAVGGWRLTKR
jgi:hypothetical protein